MTIAQLKYILGLAEYKNFSVTSEKFSVTQPTISAQLKQLEEELGVVLFDRNKRNVQVSPIGKIFLEQAKKIVYEAEKVYDIINVEKGFIGGEFRLGIIPTVATTLLPLFLGRFIKKYPNVNLIIEEHTSEKIIYKLKNRKLDAGITSTPLEDIEIKEKALYCEPFVAYVHENSVLYREKTISPEQINTNELLLLQRGHCFTNTIRNFCKNKNEQNRLYFELKSGSLETLISLVDQGLGITLLPYLYTLNIFGENKNKLKFFDSPEPAREISIVYHKEELKTHITEVIQNTILEVIREVIPDRKVKVIRPIL